MSAILFLNNLLESATVTTAAGESGDHILENAYDYRLSGYWEPTGTGNLHADAGSATAADYLGIVCTILTNSTTLTLQYSSDNFSSDINQAWTGTYNAQTNLVILGTFASHSARYWRLVFDQILDVYHVSLGARLTLSGRGEAAPWIPPQYNRKVEILNAETNNGGFLGRSVLITQHEYQLTQNLITAAWLTTNWPTIQAHIEIKPFFALAEDGGYPLFGWTSQISYPSYMNFHLLTYSLTLRGILAPSTHTVTSA